MRVFILILGSLVVNADLYGQGVVNFTNGSGASPEQRVYIDEWMNPAALAPSGRQFLVALYFSPVSDSESALTQAGAAAGFLGDPGTRTGIFTGGSRTVATDYPGGSGFFQVKGWEAAYGNTYEEAAANPAARVGKSPVFISDTADHSIPERSVDLVEGSYPDRPFQGFVIAVPEPSIAMIGIGGIVALGLLGRVRKKNRPSCEIRLH